jgi:hypothetical protein
VGVARQNLARFGAWVLEVAEDGDLPFADASFDLVSSRHPTRRRWDELARGRCCIKRSSRSLAAELLVRSNSAAKLGL